MESARLESLADGNKGKCYYLYSKPGQKFDAEDVSLREALQGN
jgi:hypothetical protein